MSESESIGTGKSSGSASESDRSSGSSLSGSESSLSESISSGLSSASSGGGSEGSGEHDCNLDVTEIYATGEMTLEFTLENNGGSTITVVSMVSPIAEFFDPSPGLVPPFDILANNFVILFCESTTIPPAGTSVTINWVCAGGGSGTVTFTVPAPD